MKILGANCSNLNGRIRRKFQKLDEKSYSPYLLRVVSIKKIQQFILFVILDGNFKLKFVTKQHRNPTKYYTRSEHKTTKCAGNGELSLFIEYFGTLL